MPSNVHITAQLHVWTRWKLVWNFVLPFCKPVLVSHSGTQSEGCWLFRFVLSECCVRVGGQMQTLVRLWWVESYIVFNRFNLQIHDLERHLLNRWYAAYCVSWPFFICITLNKKLEIKSIGTPVVWWFGHAGIVHPKMVLSASPSCLSKPTWLSFEECFYQWGSVSVGLFWIPLTCIVQIVLGRNKLIQRHEGE